MAHFRLIGFAIIGLCAYYETSPDGRDNAIHAQLSLVPELLTGRKDEVTRITFTQL